MQLRLGQHSEQVAWPAELVHPAVRGPHQRQRVTRGADPYHGPAGDEPHRGVDRGQEPRVVGRTVKQHLIQAGQKQARPGLPAGHGPEGVAGQRSALGGGRTLAAHVADHDSPRPVRRWEHVTEIPEDLRSGPARDITRRPGPARGITSRPGPARGVTSRPGPARGVTSRPGPARGVTRRPGPARGVTRRHLQAGDLRQPRRQQALFKSPRQGGSPGAVRQRGPQRNLAPGEASQGLQHRDVAGTPLPCDLVGDPEHPRDTVVLVMDRDPSPGQHARQIGPAIAAHPAVHPDVTDDQLVSRPNDIRAQPLFKRAQSAVDTRGAVRRQ